MLATKSQLVSASQILPSSVNNNSSSNNNGSSRANANNSPGINNNHQVINNSNSSDTSPPQQAPTGGENVGSNNLDRLSNVSLLAKQYLLFENSPNSTNKNSSLVKTYQRCIKIESKEQFSCKVVPRTQEGLQLIAGYHRLEEGCDAISKVHEVILSPKSFYLIMPPTYGTVHSYLLAKKKLREAEAANIFRQMVQAVQFCHEKGIVLRDLKMGKFVFHDKERTIVRLDTLEDAVLLNDLNDDGLSDKHGCPNYVSPEKAEILRSNKKYPGKATDMWGLGVILYTLLVGRYPFNDEDHSKLFVKIRRGQYSLPDHLSGPAKFLIRFLLQKDPSARPTCGEILKYSWLTNPGAHLSSSASNSSSRASNIPPSVVVSTNASNNNNNSSSSRIVYAPSATTTTSTTSASVVIATGPSSSSSSSSNSSSIAAGLSMDSSVIMDFVPFELSSADVRPKSDDSEDQVVPNIDMDSSS